MKGLAVVIFLVYFLNASVNLGSALKCYTCTSAMNAKCKDDVKDSSVGSYDCIAGENNCMSLEVQGIMTRGCAIDKFCDEYNKQDGVSCKSCKEDLCNSQNAGYVPNYGTSLAIFVALYTCVKFLF